MLGVAVCDGDRLQRLVMADSGDDVISSHNSHFSAIKKPIDFPITAR